MKVLVTGASGFVGRHLVAGLLDAGHAVETWSRSGTSALPGVTDHRLDLLVDPLPAPPLGGWEAAFHLAGHTRPALLSRTEQVLENLTMAARVIDHAAETSPGCRFVLASSAHVYGPSQEPLREDDSIAPRGAYGLSKQLCEDWALARRGQLRLVIVRPFNQIGPGLPQGLLIPDLLERIAGGEPTLRMLGSDGLRDFLDIRDAVEAYLALVDIEAPPGAIFNLCSGRPTRVSELVDGVLAHLGLERDVAFARPGSDAVLGDPSRLREATGWCPRRSLSETIAATVGPAS